MRSDEQLVALFRAGHDEAFRVIHDRYRQRLFAYARQMLPGRQDAEDALQDVFVRAYSNLRSNDRDLALRAWLYRVAHNRCVDELRRPAPPPPEALQLICSPVQDPIAQADQRESLRRLVADVRRLPPQQRSALLMRELGGMPYADLAAALGVSVPAVKSLLVRARMALAQAIEARETACSDIREELILAHDRRTRPNANSRRHLRDCPGCRQFRREIRGVSRQLAALTPALGPLGVAAKLLGLGGGGGAAASSGAAAGGGAAAVGGAVGSTGAVVSAGALATGAGHVATLIAATVVTAGGAVEIQRTITQHAPAHHRHVHHLHRMSAPAAAPPAQPASYPAVVPAPAPVPTPVPVPVSSPATVSSAATTAPLKVITGKAVKKLSSAVSTTTKDATKRLKTDTQTGSTTGPPSTSSTAVSDSTTSANSPTTNSAGASTATSKPGASTGPAPATTGQTPPAGSTSPAPAGSGPATTASAPGSAGSPSGTTGTSASGSGTS